MLLLATPWQATQQIVASLGDLTGKTMIDATNPLLPDLSGLTHGTTTSGGEQVARKLIDELGFEAVDAGTAESSPPARTIRPLPQRS